MKVDGDRRPLLFERVGFGCQQIVTTGVLIAGVTSAVQLILGGGQMIIIGESLVPQVVVGRRCQIRTGSRLRRVIVGVSDRRMLTVVDPRHFFVALLLLHASVLEPNFYLPFGETQLGRHLLSLAPHDVFRRLKHRLQHGRLVFGVRLSGPFPTLTHGIKLLVTLLQLSRNYLVNSYHSA